MNNISYVKNQAKSLSSKNKDLKYTEALNIVSKKYGFSKYEILKSKTGPIKTIGNYTIKKFEKIIKFRKLSIVAQSGMGKTFLLKEFHTILDTEKTLFINPFNDDMPIKDVYNTYKKAKFENAANFMNINFDDYDTIIIDEGWMLEPYKDLLNDLKKLFVIPNKTILLSLQNETDFESLGIKRKSYIGTVSVSQSLEKKLDIYEMYL